MRKTPSPNTQPFRVEVLVLIGFIAIVTIGTALGFVLISKYRPGNAPLPTTLPTTGTLSQPTGTVFEADQVTPPVADSPSVPSTTIPQASVSHPTVTAIASTKTPSPSAFPVASATPTSALNPTAAISPTPSATPEASVTPEASQPPISTVPPTGTAPATTTPQALNNNWRLLSYIIAPDPDQANALLIYGELLNANTSAQEISSITGSVLNDQGQTVATGAAWVVYTPVTTLPPGGRVPFEISLTGTADGSSLNLNVQSLTTTETWRQDLPASELAQVSMEDDYCVKGRISNNGAILQEALIIAVKLYDAAGRLINFSDFTPDSPGLVVGDQTLPFTICVNLPNQGVARYEIQTWGR